MAYYEVSFQSVGFLPKNDTFYFVPETLQFLTFRVYSGVRFAFSAMRKEAQNLFRMRSCRFLQNETVNPWISFILCGIRNDL